MTDDFSSDVFEPQLCVASKRLSQLTNVFRYAMETEFWPSAESVKDWSHSLSWLVKADEPIRRLAVCDSATEFSKKHFEEEGEGLSDWCDWYTGCVTSAKSTLDNADLSSKSCCHDEIFAATLDIQKALRFADALAKAARSELESLGKSLPPRFRTEYVGDSQDSYQEIEKAFSDAILDAKVQASKSYSDDNGELDQIRCMSSRKLHLLSCFYAYIHPDRWRHNGGVARLQEAHQLLLQAMTAGTAFRKSVFNRLEDSKEFPIADSTTACVVSDMTPQ